MHFPSIVYGTPTKTHFFNDGDPAEVESRDRWPTKMEPLHRISSGHRRTRKRGAPAVVAGKPQKKRRQEEDEEEEKEEEEENEAAGVGVGTGAGVGVGPGPGAQSGPGPLGGAGQPLYGQFYFPFAVMGGGFNATTATSAITPPSAVHPPLHPSPATAAAAAKRGGEGVAVNSRRRSLQQAFDGAAYPQSPFGANVIETSYTTTMRTTFLPSPCRYFNSGGGDDAIETDPATALLPLSAAFTTPSPPRYSQSPSRSYLLSSPTTTMGVRSPAGALTRPLLNPYFLPSSPERAIAASSSSGAPAFYLPPIIPSDLVM